MAAQQMISLMRGIALNKIGGDFVNIKGLKEKAAILAVEIETAFTESDCTIEDESRLDDLYYELAVIEEQIDILEEKEARKVLDYNGNSLPVDFLDDMLLPVNDNDFDDILSDIDLNERGG